MRVLSQTFSFDFSNCKNNGQIYDQRGKQFESLFEQYLIKHCTDKNYFGETIETICSGKEAVQKTTKKTDLLINDHIICQCKCSHTTWVGGLETTSTQWIEKMKVPRDISDILLDLQKTGYRSSYLSEKQQKTLTEYLSHHMEELLRYVLTDTMQKTPDFFLIFHDPDKKQTWVGTIEEYLDVIQKKMPIGTFQSGCLLTYTSGKYQRCKFKIRNPLR